jgi:hypothetical protein
MVNCLYYGALAAHNYFGWLWKSVRSSPRTQSRIWYAGLVVLRVIILLDLMVYADVLKHSAIWQAVSTTNTRPESCLSTIRAWMDNCTVDHSFCKQLRDKGDSTWHPTRLVDVSLETLGTSIRLEDDPAKLVEAEYSTLSYCWGPNPQFRKLHIGKYNDFKQGIRISDLPKTVQDAVFLTRALNLRFIWIDALCIVQDSVDHEDWLQESLKMSQVYGRSYINIAASSSATAEGGLFRERDPISVSGVFVKPYGDENEGYIITQERHWLGNLQFEPLNLRAWALQERRLSSRTLHFTDDQIYWECASLCASEVYPNGKPWDDNWSLRQKKMAASRDPTLATLHERHNAWWELVWEYSKGALSVPTDRLVAIAGLAKSYNVVPEDEYVTGHWRLDMPHGLMWFADESRSKSKETYLAPTWSWASIPPGVTVFRPGKRYCAQADIVELKLERTLDQVGPLTGCFIRLRGRMCMATFALSLKDRHFSNYKYSLKFTPEGSATTSFCLPIEAMGEYEGQTVFCMELEVGGAFFEQDQRMWIGRKWRGINPKFRGLLLIPTHQRPGEFERIGIYYESYTHFEPSLKPLGLERTFQHWKDYAKMNAAFRLRNIPSQYFEERDGRNRYTIRVI